MIANAAFLAALTEFLLAAWLAQEVSFLTGVKHLLFRQHGLAIGLFALLVFLNLFSASYACARRLFLRDTGRKLRHLDHQLATPDAALDDLREGLQP
jgi:hypothetical protein